MLVALLLVVVVSFAGTSYLVRVGLPSGMSFSELAADDVKVVEDMGGSCLVQVGQDGLERLSAEFDVEVLDIDPEDKLYVHVLPRNGFPAARLAEFGRVLTEESGVTLLRTDEAGVYALNALPVDLGRLTMHPLVSTTAQAERPSLPVVSDSIVWDLVNAVSQDSVLGMIQRYQDFYTRYSTHDSCDAAMEWTRARFEEYGCDTTFLFPFRSNYAPNAVGVRYGTTNPDVIYGICGHTDATSQHRPNHCPGADDNGSGTTAVLEACRVFRDVEFENTVYFIGFSGEEQGLYGSDSFAEYCYRRGDSIRAMLNFDMISYGRENIDTFEVAGKWSNPSCEWLVNFYIAQADTFSLLKTKKVMTNYMPYSDHHSFWLRGYPALLGIENDFTPMYHTIGDTIGPMYYRNCGTNNVPLATDAIRAAVASIAKLAGAHLPVGLEEQTGRGPLRVLGVEPSLGQAPLSVRLSAPLGPGGRVEVFDATGRQVQVLEPGRSSAVSWDGTDGTGQRLAAGIYLFRATDRGRTSTAKAVLTD